MTVEEALKRRERAERELQDARWAVYEARMAERRQQTSAEASVALTGNQETDGAA